MFEKTKPVSWGIIATFLLVDAALITAVVASFSTDLWTPIARATRGLVNTTLQANLVMMLVVGAGVIGVLGRLRGRDVGLAVAKLPRAAGLTVLVWMVAQLGGLLADLLTRGTVVLDPAWARYGLAIILGWLIGQLFGNALFEEIAFRGFLLPQLYGKLVGWRDRPRARLVVATLGSQAVFALMHIPVRLYEGLALAELLPTLVFVWLLGMLFAAIYLLTDNLLFAVGVHALANQPTALFPGHIPGSELVVGLVIAILWAWLRRPRTAPAPATTPGVLRPSTGGSYP
jgi:membrane protease YdiL (CAAX protease family)